MTSQTDLISNPVEYNVTRNSCHGTWDGEEKWEFGKMSKSILENGENNKYFRNILENVEKLQERKYLITEDLN